FVVDIKTPRALAKETYLRARQAPLVAAVVPIGLSIGFVVLAHWASIASVLFYWEFTCVSHGFSGAWASNQCLKRFSMYHMPVNIISARSVANMEMEYIPNPTAMPTAAAIQRPAAVV